jgi:hypothetical protein
MTQPDHTCTCGRAMRREVRVPGVTEPGRSYTFYSCDCGRVDCVADEPEQLVERARWPSAS